MNVASITCPKCGGINNNIAKFCSSCGSEIVIGYSGLNQEVSQSPNISAGENSSDKNIFYLNRPNMYFVRSILLNTKGEMIYRIEANGVFSFIAILTISFLLFLGIVAISQRLLPDAVTAIIGIIGLLLIFLEFALLINALFKAPIFSTNNEHIATVKKNFGLSNIINYILSNNWVIDNPTGENNSYITFQNRYNGAFSSGNENYKIEIHYTNEKKGFFKHLIDIDAVDERTGKTMKLGYVNDPNKYAPTDFQVIASKEIDDLTIASFATVIVAKFFTISRFNSNSRPNTIRL